MTYYLLKKLSLSSISFKYGNKNDIHKLWITIYLFNSWYSEVMKYSILYSSYDGISQKKFINHKLSNIFYLSKFYNITVLSLASDLIKTFLSDS